MSFKILLLGSEGYLGSVLLEKLIKKKDVKLIYGIDLCFFGQNNKYKKKFKLLKKNYKNLSKNFINKFDIVIDLINISNDPSSELNPKFTLDNNYNNKIKFCEKINKNIRYIYASSCSVYGKNKKLVNEKSKTYPISLYAKLCKKFEDYLVKSSFNYLIFRFGTLFGWSKRMRYDIAINKLIRDGYYGKKIEVLGGNQYRFFCYNEYAAMNIIENALNYNHANSRKILNIGNFNIKIIDLAKQIYKLLKNKNIFFYHEKNNIDERSYKILIKKNKNNKYFFSKKYINDCISKTISKIKRDKNPYDPNKITLNAYLKKFNINEKN